MGMERGRGGEKRERETRKEKGTGEKRERRRSGEGREEGREVNEGKGGMDEPPAILPLQFCASAYIAPELGLKNPTTSKVQI